MDGATDACGDKPVWALNQMQVAVEVARARGDRTALRALGLRIQRLGVVHEHVERKMASLAVVDDVCVYLRFAQLQRVEVGACDVERARGNSLSERGNNTQIPTMAANAMTNATPSSERTITRSTCSDASLDAAVTSVPSAGAGLALDTFVAEESPSATEAADSAVRASGERPPSTAEAHIWIAAAVIIVSIGVLIFVIAKLRRRSLVDASRLDIV